MSTQTPPQTQPIFVYFHTHWDREWYLPFREYQHRLLKVVDDVLDAVETEKLPCFTLDGQTVLLEDYLAFRSTNKPRLEKLIASERLSVGPWYVMPDEFLVSGESLIRNLQRGIALSEAFGEKTFTGYLPDTFGHSADIPMLLKQSEITSAVVWRGVWPEHPFFDWQSPSGDSVLTYHLTQGYFQNMFHMGKDTLEKTAEIVAWSGKVQPRASADMPVLFPMGADHLGIVPHELPLMDNLLTHPTPVTVDQFMIQAQTLLKEPLETFHGELRDHQEAYILPGVYSSRLYLKQWNRRLEWRLTRQLEQLLSWEILQGKPRHGSAELDFLWQTLLLNHPHDSICGCSVDSVHRENESRFEQIAQLSDAMMRDCHHVLQQQFQANGTVLLINLGDKPYTGVVAIQQDYTLPQTVPAPLPGSQVLHEETILDESYLLDTSVLPLSENKALRRQSLIWAEAIPAHGLLAVSKSALAPDEVVISDNVLENNHLKVTLEPTGQFTIVDKLTQATYQHMHHLTRQWQQGDSYNAAPVPGTHPETANLAACTIEEHGPLQGSWLISSYFPTIDLTLETLVSLRAGSSRLDFETRFTNETPDHKIQVGFTTAKPLTEVIAEGHFAPISRPYEADYRIAAHMPAPKQKELKVQAGPIQRFIGFDQQTLITEGLTEYEVEGNTLQLTLLRAFGMLSRDDTGVRGSHAGPPLPTVEGQCLHRAAAYRYAWQPGFNLENAFHQADIFYGSVYGFDRTVDVTAASTSWQAVTWDNPNVVSTALIPTEVGLILRMFNPTNSPQTTRLRFPEMAKSPHLMLENLRGKTLSTSDDPTLTLAPYTLQTMQIQV